MALFKRCEDLELARNPTKTEKNCIKTWYNTSPSKRKCPFMVLEFLGEDCNCLTLIKGEGHKMMCPCVVYPTIQIEKLVKLILNIDETPKSRVLIPRSRSQKRKLIRRH